MIVKSQIKLMRSLHQKKYRNQHGLFFVEGRKTVYELLNSDFESFQLYTTEPELTGPFKESFIRITEAEMEKISALATPTKVFGSFRIPTVKKIDFKGWIVALDDIRDPGNLGTIIRLCDWFGIENLVCSPNTVDCYNPKVLQATMGSIARVNIGYTDLKGFLTTSEVPVYGAFMGGEEVYDVDFPKTGILVMGNESKGISAVNESFISKKVGIPQFGKQTAESLNVATATAILLNELRRGREVDGS